MPSSKFSDYDRTSLLSPREKLHAPNNINLIYYGLQLQRNVTARHELVGSFVFIIMPFRVCRVKV